MTDYEKIISEFSKNKRLSLLVKDLINSNENLAKTVSKLEQKLIYYENPHSSPSANSLLYKKQKKDKTKIHQIVGTFHGTRINYDMFCVNMNLENSVKPLISIIILNYNAGELLINCVESIKKSNFQNFEIIVVDNNSNDESHLICKKKNKEIILINNLKNFGFCEGNNIGVRKAKGKFIIIINPDTTVTPNWLNGFLDAFQNNGDGIYQPKIISLDDKKTILSTGNMIHLFGFGFARDKGNKYTDHLEKVEKIPYSSGTCIFTTKKLFEKLGMFDPFIFLYHDDLDLSWRATLQKIDSFYVPTITIFHKSSYNFRWSGKKFFWLERNRKYCILTHYSKETQKKIATQLFLTDLLVWITYLIKGFIWIKIKAELDIMKNKDAINKKYLEIEKTKMISDEEIMQKFSDTIWIPTYITNNFSSKLFNLILKKLSKKARIKMKLNI